MAMAHLAPRAFDFAKFRVKYATNIETGQRVAIKILDKDKIQKQNMGAQIKKEVRAGGPEGWRRLGHCLGMKAWRWRIPAARLHLNMSPCV